MPADALSPAEFQDTFSILEQVSRSPVGRTRLNAVVAWGELIANGPPEMREQAVQGLVDAALFDIERQEASEALMEATAEQVGELDEPLAHVALARINQHASVAVGAEHAERAAKLLWLCIEWLRRGGKLSLAAGGLLAVRAYLRLLLISLSQIPLKVRQSVLSSFGIALLLTLLVFVLLKTFTFSHDLEVGAVGALMSGLFGASLLASMAGAAITIPASTSARPLERAIDSLFQGLAMAVLTPAIYLATQVILAILAPISDSSSRLTGAMLERGEALWWGIDFTVLAKLALIVGGATLLSRLVSVIPISPARFAAGRAALAALTGTAAALLLSAWLLPLGKEARWIEAAAIVTAAAIGACLADFHRSGSAFEKPARAQFGVGWALVTTAAAAAFVALLVWPAWRLQAQTLRNDRDVKTVKDAIDRSRPIRPICEKGVGRPTEREIHGLRLGKFYPIRFCDQRRDLVLTLARDPAKFGPDENSFLMDDNFLPLYLLVADGTGDPLRRAVGDLGLRGDLLANTSVRYLCIGELEGTSCAKTPALPPERVIEAIPKVLMGRPVPNLSEGGVSAFFDANPDEELPQSERKFTIRVRAQSPGAR